jgi:hypothetical protein
MSYIPGICFKGLRNTIRNVSVTTQMSQPRLELCTSQIQVQRITTTDQPPQFSFAGQDIFRILPFVFYPCVLESSPQNTFIFRILYFKSDNIKVQIRIRLNISVPTVHILCLPDRQHNKHEEIACQHSEEVCSRNTVCLTQHHAHRLVSVVTIVQSCIREETLQHRPACYPISFNMCMHIRQATQLDNLCSCCMTAMFWNVTP